MAPSVLTPEQSELVMRNLGYAENVARVAARNVPHDEVGLSLEDCVQLGLLGLTQAATRFDSTDHDHGRATVEARFRSYAYLRIRGAVIDEVRRLGGPERQLPPPSSSFDNADQGGENLDFAVDDLDDWIDFRSALDSLGARDKAISLHIMAGVPYTELGPALGVSEQRMYQMAKDIRRRLAEKVDRAAA